jgi:serine/threonine protein kinase
VTYSSINTTEVTMTVDGAGEHVAENAGSSQGDETRAPTSVSASGPRPLTHADLPPDTVVDKYRLGQVLGQGGMGLVVAAEHVQLRERVALKFLRVEGESGQSFRSRFRREAQICAQIKNEHITRVIDIGTYKDADYMVMERLAGSDLRGFLKQRSALDVAAAVDFAVQACEGLAEVHARGVVHRDLKPSNLFVTQRSNGSPLIKILDFGISKWASEMDAEEEELTQTGAVLGSPKYMAPEQLFGSSTVDARADVYSIGAILYEMLTGRPPFEEPTFARLCVRISSGQAPVRPRERRAEIPEELDVAVMLCLEPSAATRLPNVAAVAGEILAAIGDRLAEATRERLQAVLDGGTSSSAATGPLMRSGQYVAASLTLSRTGSRSGTPAAAAIDVSVDAPRDRRKVAWIAAALVAAIVLVFVLRRAAGPTSVEPTAAAAVPIPSAPMLRNTAPAMETAAPIAIVSAASTSKPAPIATAKHVAKAPAAKTAEPTPSVVPSPAPVPTPIANQPPKSANPLEDRQ